MPIDAKKVKCATPGAVFHTKLSNISTRRGTVRAQNKYAGNCEMCGHRVEAGAGCLDQHEGRWIVFC